MEINNKNYLKYSNCTTNIRNTDFDKISKTPKKQMCEIKTDKIFGQKDCWKLFNPEVFEEFIKSDSKLYESVKDILEIARIYGLTPSINLFIQIKKSHPKINDFYKLLKSKYGIDLNIPPKVYRFIGKSELEALKRDGKVKPRRGFSNNFDVTLNPNLNWNVYRITFKPQKKFSVLDSESNIKENPGSNHDYFYYYQGEYTIDDIETIEQYRNI